MPSADPLRFGPIEVDFGQRQLTVDGLPASIGARAFDVLTHLIECGGRVVTKHELMERVWCGLIVEENNLQVQISALRKCMGAQAIATIPGRGYQFTLKPDQLARLEPTSDATDRSATSRQARGATVSQKRHGNLPEMLPALIGRADEVLELAALVREHRLISVVGAGGIGKTRLARATAQALSNEFADGVWMVELAPVADPGLLPAAVAQALGETLQGNRSAEGEVIDALRDRTALLVLDNCEHLLGAATSFAEALAQRAPKTHLMITSQEPLQIADEHLYRTSTLSLPATPDLVAAQGSGAVNLLINRVQALQPAFALTEHNVAEVVDICRRLDGLPLAIELAAARVPLLGVSGVRKRLHERFRLLSQGTRTAMRRHQTLREALDWSHGLLDNEERTVFRRAGVFAGSFTMDTAQQVLSDAQVDGWAVLEHLGALVDKSLVVPEPLDPPRYRLLESTRAYALEKLHDAAETSTTQFRHAHAVLAVFETGLEQEWTVPWAVRVDRHLPDLDNLRAALDWAERGESELHIALAGASAWMWQGTGHRAEGLRRCAAARARIDKTTPPAFEARLLAAWCVLSSAPAGASERNAAERAVALYRSLDDQRNAFLALERLAITSARSGKIKLIERAWQAMSQLHDARWPLASRWHMLNARAQLLFADNRLDEAQDAAEECMRLATTVGDARLVMSALMLLEWNAALRGQFDEAVRRGRELIQIGRSVQFSSNLSIIVSNLSSALTELDELDEALTTARQATALHLQAGTPLWLWLVPFALLAYKRGRPADAARAFGRADAKHNWSLARERQARDALLRLLQRALPSAELKRLVAEGAKLSDEGAARVALAA